MAADDSTERKPQAAGSSRGPAGDRTSRAGDGPSGGSLNFDLPASSHGSAAAGRPSGRFTVVGPHARGGLGEVFRATDREVGREVALKEMRPEYAADPGSRERFVREAEVTGQLEHPGIVPVYGMGRHADGRPYYAMRFIRGTTLAAAIAAFHEGGPKFDGLAFRQLLGRFVSACQTVAYAHDRGVIHRDLKPSNVMLGPFGEVLVIDWGLARHVHRPPAAAAAPAPAAHPPLPSAGSGSTEPTQMGECVGTFGYMAPEQAAGRWDVVGPAADVYSLGAVLYTLLTKTPTITGNDRHERRQRTQANVIAPARAVLPGVPAALAAVAHKALATEPGERHASALALAADCERWLADAPVECHRDSAGVRLRRWARQHVGLVAASVATLAVGVVALAVSTLIVRAARDAAEQQRDHAREQRLRLRGGLDTMLTQDMIDRLTAQPRLTDKQRAFLQEALEYYQEFAKDAATDAAGRAMLAEAHYRVGNLHRVLGDPAAAAAAYGTAQGLYDRLAADAPDEPRWADRVAKVRTNVGTILLPRDPAAAQAEFAAALAGRERLLRAAPGDPHRQAERARARINVGTAQRDAKDVAAAEQSYRDAIAELAPLVQAGAGTKAAADLGRARLNLSSMIGRPDAAKPRVDEAEREADAAVTLFRAVVAAEPDAGEWRGNYATALLNHAKMLDRQKKYAAAEARCREACGVHTRMAADGPGVAARLAGLAAAHTLHGQLLWRLGRADAAVAAHREAAAVRERLLGNEPDVIEHAALLAQNCYAVFDFGGGRADGPDLLRQAQAAAAALGRATVPSTAPRPEFHRALVVLAHAQLAANQRAAADATFARGLALAPQKAVTRCRVAWAAALARAGDGTAAVAEVAAVDATLTEPEEWYNAACAVALAAGPAHPDRAARAVALLRRAVEAGFSDGPQLLADADLAAVRGRPEFAALLWDVAETP